MASVRWFALVRQGDWALRGRQHEYASDSSDGGESPPPYDADAAYAPHYEDFRILNRLPNVGGALLSQSQVKYAVEIAPSTSIRRPSLAIACTLHVVRVLSTASHGAPGPTLRPWHHRGPPTSGRRLQRERPAPAPAGSRVQAARAGRGREEARGE